MDDLEIKLDELTRNPSPRVPVSLCLDTSASMEGTPIVELQDGLKRFFVELLENKGARYNADISVVTFGETAQQLLDFRPIEKQRVPELVASGRTPMGRAVELALDTLELRKREYQIGGLDYYQPWLVLMTDGQPTDDITTAATRVQRLVNDRKLTVYPIGIGPQADLAALAAFSPGRAPFRLQGLAFREFFSWLSQSIVRVSATSVGDDVQMPPVKGWSEDW